MLNDEPLARFLQGTAWPGYAPRFRVKLDGVDLSEEVVADVLDVQVTLDMDESSGFQLTINNSDERLLSLRRHLGRKFPTKYSDTTLFDIGRRVHVELGYGPALLTLMSGKITALTVAFPESGASTLSVTGQDDFTEMRGREPEQTERTRHLEVTDHDLFTLLAERIGINIHLVDDGSLSIPYQEIVQEDDDLTFMLNRARRIGFDCFIRADQAGNPILHFVKRGRTTEGVGGAIFPLEWGESLISFSPTLNVSRQVEGVTVRGWDPRQKAVIEYTATAADIGAGQHNGAVAAGKTYTHEKVMQLVDYSIDNISEAQSMAIGALRDRVDEYVTGTGRCLGNPLMRQADSVALTGLGQRFDGIYVIKKVVHTINASGYTTEFEIRRPDDGGAEPAQGGA